MDHLKEGIGLRGYGQLNPLVEYQKEGFDMFEAMLGAVRQDVVEKVFSVQVRREQDVQKIEEQQQQRAPQVVMSHGNETIAPGPAVARREGDKVGRNDPCPCGSGKKYKRCHGK
jgi:preprotein translocase subunit SecA